MNESLDNVFVIHDYIEQSIFSTGSGIVAAILFGLAGLCGLMLLVWLIKEKLKRPQTPGEQALQNLARLKIPIDDVSLAKIEHFYCNLIVIAKAFLGAQFNLRVHGKTDIEMIDILTSDKRFKEESFICLTDVFQGCQSIKFAASSAQVEQMTRDKDCVVSVVDMIEQQSKKDKLK